MFTRRSFSRNRWVAIIGGGLYIALGVIGFAVTTGVPFSGVSGGVLWQLLLLNPAQNLLHVALGLALVSVAIAAPTRSSLVNTTVGLLCFALGYYGLFVIEQPNNLLALNTWGNALHFASSAVLLAVGLGADRVAQSGNGLPPPA